MYYCLDEGHVFEEPRHYIETHGLDSPPYEEYDGCPVCGGAFEEAEECDDCEKWFPVSMQEEDEWTHRMLCKKCRENN